MSRAHSAVLLLVGLLILPALALAAGPPSANPDYDRAVKRARAMAEGLSSYSLAGRLELTTRARGAAQGMSMEADLVAAARWPDLLHSSQKGQMMDMSLGSGPDGAWFHLGQLGNAYQGPPASLTRDLDGLGDMDLTPEKIFNFYAGLAQFLLEPGLGVAPGAGAENLTVAGKAIECVVFTTMGPEVLEGGKEPSEGPRKIWFDPVSGLVLRQEFTVNFVRQGQPMRQDVVFALDEFALDGEVDPAAFTFAAPAGARIVDRLDLLTNPDAMTGQQAPDISFTDLEGNTLQLSSLKGEPVFIDFWATWCGPCRIEMPHIQTLWKEMGEAGRMHFIAASSEDAATIRSFVTKQGYEFPIYTVDANAARTLYRTTSIPAGFVIDAEGMIQAHMIGAQSEAQLRAAFAKAGVK